MVCNVLCGNTDNHARNHAAFRQGPNLKLPPACDTGQQSRASERGDASDACLEPGLTQPNCVLP
ncbi:hypothetical protein [Bradyrhizobium sp. I1.14.4]|uniref:hypothetical protein n=1 Tax=unclassified Bradyrhizobium TaxID=2631580 RepID=UPI003D23B792